VSLLEDLARPEAYPEPRPAAVTAVTTHISWVFLTEREVFKVKRPVDYGFVDCSTPERRERFCHEEVRLNRRLAPDVYLGVVPVRRGPAGHAFHGAGPVVDHAVRMRRLDEAASAEALLRRGALDPAQLDRLAARLAAFYAGVPPAPEHGTAAAVRAVVTENLEQARPFVGRFLDRDTFEAVRDAQLGFLRREGRRLGGRLAAGRIRDGHGDLRLEHVYFETPGADPLVIDCVEFSERLRMVDVAADVAFLAMELRARGRADLAERFLAGLAEAADDHRLYGVVDFYTVYRAWVRAKVAAVLAADPTTPPDKAGRKGEEARALFRLARELTAGPGPPGPLVLVGGLIGSGKSTLAAAVGRTLGVPVVGSDRTRKALAGVAPTERAPAEAYSATFSFRTFAELFRRAEVVLRSGRGVVLDATFGSRDLRGRARELAARHGRRFLFVETRCDEATLRERLRRRAEGPSVSDATEGLLDRLRREFQPVTELPAAEHRPVDTTRPTAEQVAAVRAALRAPPPGPAGSGAGP
jgi:aminoglycoside phosphotransferase family enzyme/predicted kinase